MGQKLDANSNALQGLLLGGDTYAYAEAPEEMVAAAGRWVELTAAHGVSMGATAVAFAAMPGESPDVDR